MTRSPELLFLTDQMLAYGIGGEVGTNKAE